MPIALARPARLTQWDDDGAPDLDERIADVLARIHRDAGITETDLGAAVTELRERIAAGGRGGLRLAELALQAQDLRFEQQEHVAARRSRALGAVQSVLARPRAEATVEKLLERAALEACRSCGFDRAMLFVVDGSRLVAHSTYFRGHDGWAAECHEVAREHVPGLAPHLLETEMIRRRAAALMSDPMQDERAFRPIIDKIETSGYVAAPIMPEGKVIATIHADTHFSGRRVDAIDRDALAAFAAGLGSMIERRVLAERLVEQRDHLRAVFAETDQVVSNLCDSAIQLRRSRAAGTPALAPTTSTPLRAAPLLAGPSRAEALLSRRELEVLRLLATGATNAAIADQLVLSEGTVKSHVKRILRKLRASNRAEAVSRFMRLEGGMEAANDADLLLRD